ncbi:MAG: caspase family protein [Pirellulaceae bacterium]
MSPNIFLAVLALFTVGTKLPIQAAEDVAADTCILELSLPEGATVSVNGRDYGGKREFTWRNLGRGKIFAGKVDVRYADGTVEERTVLIEGGRKLRLAAQHPSTPRPQLVLRTGHSQRVSCAAFSPNGEWIATGSFDKSIIVWDRATGGELRRYLISKGSVGEVVFSPDNRYILNASSDAIDIFDVRSGRLVKTLEGPQGYLTTFGFSRDGARLLSGDYNGATTVWDFASGRKTNSFRLYPDDKHYTANVSQVLVRPRHAQFLSVTDVYESEEKVGKVKDYSEYLNKRKHWSLLVLWDAASKKKIHSFYLPNGQFGRAAFTPDGEEVVAVASIKAAEGESERFLVKWDVDAREERRRAPLEGWVRDMRSTSDGKHLELLTGDEGVVSIKRFDSETLVETATLDHWQTAEPYPLAVSNDWTESLVVDSKSEVAQRFLRGEVNASLKSSKEVPFEMKFYTQSRVAIAQRDELVLLIDPATQQVLHRFPIEGEHDVFDAEFVAKPGRVVINTNVSNGPHEIRIYDATTGVEVCRFKTSNEDDYVPRVLLSSDGNHVVAEVDGKAVAWDTATGRVIGRFVGKKNESVSEVLFAPDGKSVIAGTFGFNTPKRVVPAAIQWDPSTGASHVKMRVPEELMSHTPFRMAYSDDRNLLITVGPTLSWTSLKDNIHTRCCLWDAAGGYLRSFGIKDDFAETFTSPDGRLLVMDYNEILSTADGAVLREFKGKPQSFAFDSRLLSVTDDQGGSVLIDVSTGSEVVRIVRLANEEDWIAVTPEGLFDGTPHARDLVSYRIDNALRPIPVDRFFQDYYRPGLLQEVFAGGRPMPNGEFANKAAPLVRITSPQQGSSAEEPRVTLEVEVADRGGGVEGPWLMQNGARVLADGERSVDGELVRRSFTVALVDGDNRFEVRAASGDGSWESEPAVLVVKHTQPVAQPAVHLVAIGVNKYRDEKMNLKFAAPDAHAMAALFESRGPELYGAERVHVTSLIDEQVTRQGVEKALGDAASRAKPQDTLVVYLAGHGTTLGQRYFFIPHEFQAEAEKLDDDIREQGIAADVLGDWVQKVPALKRVLIFDTCQSGGALPVGRNSRDPFAFRGAIERLSHARGFFTIAAASAGEAAEEVPELKHGLLTYALLAGAGAVSDGPLARHAIKATPDDRTVEIREWFSFAQDKVPLLTRLYLGQEQYIGFSGEGASFPILPAQK